VHLERTVTSTTLAATALLATRGLRKTFGGIVAVDDVDIEIGVGESVGLVGPNGAGKTTLFDCIFGHVRHDAGEIQFRGATIDRLPAYGRARLGIGRTYQRVEVFPDLTVEEHLAVAERARRDDGRLWKNICGLSAPSTEELAAVEEVLNLVGLTQVRARPVSALGLGTCRLVELGRALVGKPSLLMADEPSSGLDVMETQELASVLRVVQREHGMAMILVEHDLAMASAVVDRIVVMNLGRVIASGAFDEVMAQPVVRKAYLG
jgi:branched-chain amino acid transport system ATP-binding protein